MPEDAVAPDAGRPFRLASWNMNHWQTPPERRTEGWAWLGQAGLDLVLIQETVPQGRIRRDAVVYREIAGRRPWGSAIVALGDGIEIEELWSVGGGARYRHRLATTHPGSVAVARVSVPGIAPITAVSIYNVLDGSPSANLLRVIADLVPLLDSVDGERVIVGGDLNVYGAVAEGRRTRAGVITNFFNDLGLHPVGSLKMIEKPTSPMDCPCGKGGICGHIPTWKGLDLDHLFVSSGLRSQVRSLTVEQAVVERGLSDHAALLLALDLSPTPVAHAWDVETFLVEIAARHGPEIAGVVGALTAWAERKEDALRAAGVRDRQLTDYDIPRAIDPTLYARLSFFDRSLRPQWLFALHAASATLDVSFQYMSHPPFDNEAGREGLRAMLNEIPGVAIPASRLGGRPQIALTKLLGATSLGRLIAAFDGVVDQTRPAIVAPALIEE
jgi:hypothetical protein